MIIKVKREKVKDKGFNECIRVYDASDGLFITESEAHHPESNISFIFEGYNLYSPMSQKNTIFIELNENLAKKTMNLTPQEEANRLIEQYMKEVFGCSETSSQGEFFVSTQCAIKDVQNTIDVLGRAQDKKWICFHSE